MKEEVTSEGFGVYSKGLLVGGRFFKVLRWDQVLDPMIFAISACLFGGSGWKSYGIVLLFLFRCSLLLHERRFGVLECRPFFLTDMEEPLVYG